MLLAIDTAAHLCAAAVYDTGKAEVVSELSEDIGRGHAERLMDVIAAALAKANTDYSGITRVAATVGPGSFTGIRVGLATARGIGLALSVPVTGVSTLDALHAHALSLAPELAGKPILTALDARRGEVYAQFHNSSDSLPPGPFVEKAETVCGLLKKAGREIAICGSAAAIICERAGLKTRVVHQLAAAPVSAIAAIAAGSTATKPEPLYLRAPDAKPQAGFALQRA